MNNEVELTRQVVALKKELAELKEQNKNGVAIVEKINKENIDLINRSHRMREALAKIVNMTRSIARYPYVTGAQVTEVGLAAEEALK